MRARLPMGWWNAHVNAIVFRFLWALDTPDAAIIRLCTRRREREPERGAMRLRSRINDWTYRMYDRMRHRDAWSVPVGETAGLDALRGHKYAVLVTFRRDGSPVPTPVWFGLDGSGRFYARTAARTGKVARIHHDARVQVFPSDARGEPKGMAVEGSARILPPEDAPRAEAALKASYGLGRRLYEWLLGEREAVYIEVTMPADR